MLTHMLCAGALIGCGSQDFDAQGNLASNIKVPGNRISTNCRIAYAWLADAPVRCLTLPLLRIG